MEIDIVGPLSFWLGILVLGVVIEVVILPFTPNSISGLIGQIAGWIIYLPGSIILPLIVAVWIAERVGATRNKVGPAVTVGLINAAYTALIYVIAIFIIYLLIKYITPTFLSSVSLTTFAEYSVGLPVAIILILVPVIAALSAARHASM